MGENSPAGVVMKSWMVKAYVVLLVLAVGYITVTLLTNHKVIGTEKNSSD